jgi:DNA-binding transcriptional LysR family regulator
MRSTVEKQTENRQNRTVGSSVQMRMIDLNLFRVFDAVMHYRSVREASRMLSVTPSAVSHALRRLRQALHDELFISTESSMQPTRRALELAPAIREGLQNLELALIAKESAGTEALRTFHIAATDYACMVILPRLVKRLAPGAPRVALQVSACNRLNVAERLQTGCCDLIIGSFNRLEKGLRHCKLLSEDHVLTVRNDHPLTHCELTKERLLAFSRVTVEPGGDEEIEPDNLIGEERSPQIALLDSAILKFSEEMIGLDGRPAVRVPHFAAVVPLLQVTDMVAILPRRLACLAAANAGIGLLDLPYPSPRLEIEMVWHRRTDYDQGLQWLLSELVGAVDGLE